MVALDEELLGSGIGVVVKKKAVSGKAVTPCAPDLLVIRFYRARQMIVNYESDITFVDTHAESIGCDDGLDAGGHEPVLRAGSFKLAHPAVVRLNAQTGHLKLGRNLFDAL